MGDPELVARAQRAAARLERSWDRWRRLHGLAAEKAQPVSSYVGYSLAEPWGRPRVVFGVGAEEAEQLSALLEQDVDTDPRFRQGLLWEPDPASYLPEAGEQPVNGARANRAQVNGAQANGAQVPEAAVPGARQAGPQPEPAPTDPGGDWAQSLPTFHPAPPADGAAGPDRGAPQNFNADLAGWTSGELPGQASAGLAVWPSPGPPAAGEGERARGVPGPGLPDRREAAPRAPGATAATPDPTAWLRLT
jgi:hypothetical protein